MTDWADAKSLITDHFSVGEMCTLHAWNKLATDADGMDKNKIIMLAHKMEEIRGFLGAPINVHCGFRSVAYNKSQSINPPADVHSMSIACDFDCLPHLTIQEVKDKLEPVLENLGIRLEKSTATWVHVDTKALGPSGRYFTA